MATPWSICEVRSDFLTKLARQPAGSAGGIGGQFRSGFAIGVRGALEEFAKAVQQLAAANVESGLKRPATSTGNLGRLILESGFYRVDPSGNGANIGIMSHLDSRTFRDWRNGDKLGSEGLGIHGYWYAVEFGTAVTGHFAREVRGIWRTQRYPAHGSPVGKTVGENWLTILHGNRGPLIHISNIEARAPIRRAYDEVLPSLPRLLEAQFADKLPDPLSAGERKLQLKFTQSISGS